MIEWFCVRTFLCVSATMLSGHFLFLYYKCVSVCGDQTRKVKCYRSQTDVQTSYQASVMVLNRVDWGRSS